MPEESQTMPQPAHPRAGRSVRAIGLFLAITVLALAADLISKHVVFAAFLNQPDLEERVEQIRRRVQADGGPAAWNSQDPHFSRTVLQHMDLSRPLIPGAVDVTISTNPGVVFGWDALPRWVVNSATGVMVVLVGVFFAASPRRAWSVHLALGLLLGGALGNLYDRLFSVVSLPHLAPIRNHVRDFIDCSDLHYPYIFNLADSWLVIGVAVMFLQGLLGGRQKNRPTGNGTADSRGQE